MNRRGFTLIELIVTLALLAVISVISFVAIGGVLNSSKENECKNLVSSIKTAAKEYVSDKRYATGDEKLTVNENGEKKVVSLTVSFLKEKNYLSGDFNENPLNKNDELYSANAILVDVYVRDDLTVESVYVSYRENDSYGFSKCN